jgi:hypothetical protein
VAGDGEDDKADAKVDAASGEHGLFTATPQWTSPVFYWGLAVGGLLIVAGFASEIFNMGTALMIALLLAAGLGIIFGAFGSLALLKYQGVSVAGVGALGVLLFVLLTGGAGRHLTIVVKGLPTSSQATLLIGDELHAGLVKNRREFVLLTDKPAAETMDFSVAWDVWEPVEGEAELKKNSVEALINNIDVSNIRAHIGGGRETEWTFDAEKRTLRIGRSVFVNGDNDPNSKSADLGLSFSLVGQAFAQEAPVNLQQTLLELESDSLSVRRAARATLAEQAPQAVPQMMDFWRADPDNYRKALGVSVALTEYLRENKSSWQTVSNALQPEDYELLVGATDYPDETLQEFATEFLFDLGAPASTDAIIKGLPMATQDGQYNSIFVLTNVVPKLGTVEKVELASALTAPGVTQGFGPVTTAEYQKLLASLKAQ